MNKGIPIQKILDLIEVTGSTTLTAEELGINRRTVQKRLRRLGLLEKRELLPKKMVDGIPYALDKNGYWRATREADRKDSVTHRAHRLVASKKSNVIGMHVHHENQDKADLSEENLTAMSPSAHVHHHKKAQDGHVLS